MNEFSQEIEDFIPEYLSSLEESVLEELSIREKNYSLRFNGLRRLLKDVHQQKLTRALERLQEDSLITQFPDGGYGLGNESYVIKFVSILGKMTLFTVIRRIIPIQKKL
ncbi:MAG: hypothetical protein ACW98W_12850 [Candidatus Hodarchaeales archaeon]|jgi:hypothetical protein